MEEEKILSGYCRALDKSRMVIAVYEDGKLDEVECDYLRCPHFPSCPIIAQLSE